MLYLIVDIQAVKVFLLNIDMEASEIRIYLDYNFTTCGGLDLISIFVESSCHLWYLEYQKFWLNGIISYLINKNECVMYSCQSAGQVLSRHLKQVGPKIFENISAVIEFDQSLDPAT